jgi:hypothetical protein
MKIQFLLFLAASVKCGFFDSFFDDAEQQQPKPQKSKICKSYECRNTKKCVAEPIDCECEDDGEEKCKNGNWYVCVVGTCQKFGLSKF